MCKIFGKCGKSWKKFEKVVKVGVGVKGKSGKMCEKLEKVVNVGKSV